MSQERNIVHEIQELLNMSLSRNYTEDEEGAKPELFVGKEEFDYIYQETHKLKKDLPERKRVDGLTIKTVWGVFVLRPSERFPEQESPEH